ncbi:efflux RND transporter permease subunit [Francisellaceae bacterium]|nr:efflux RND transporter permease subunit [Francisellaceae bacterium]
MKFTDIFIRRPILATSISLLILVAGLGSAFKLQVMEYPQTTSAIITVTVSYPGASPDVVQGFITTPLEQAIGTVDGINYMISNSVQGTSTITCYIDLNFDPNAAMTNIMIEVQSKQNVMPKQALSPSISVSVGNTFPALILSFTSTDLNEQEISAYLTNVVSPQIYALGGISNVIVWGNKPYAMRIWLEPSKMRALGVTSNEVYNVLSSNSLIVGAGQLQTPYQYITLNAETSLSSPEQYEALVVKNDKGNLIRIRDIATVELGAQYYTSSVSYNNKTAVFLGLQIAPSANQLTVIDKVIENIPYIKTQMPKGLDLNIVMNTNDFIEASIDDVVETLIEAVIIVIVVLTLFLGSMRAVIVPLTTIPLSMIGAFLLMMAMGFSINLLTLLSMVLAIGLVVDDAIVVLENIYRHIEEGRNSFIASILGAREVAGPVIVMTLTLAAVYAPIGMMGGLTGSLFTEFAYTLAAAVIISGIVALTFSPMLSSKIITPKMLQGRTVKFVDRIFDKVKVAYQKALTFVLGIRLAMLAFAAIILTSCYLLFVGIGSELAPQEDQGFLGVQGTAPSPANVNYLSSFNPMFNEIFKTIPGGSSSFIIDGYPQQNNIFGGLVLVPWGDRSNTQMELARVLQEKVNDVAGVQSYVFQQPSLPGVNFGPPVQFVLTAPAGSYKVLNSLADTLIEKAMGSGLFLFAQSDLRFDDVQINLHIDYQKAGDLGITNEDIGNVLGSSYAGGYVNFFDLLGYSYQVIPQVSIPEAQTPEQLLNLQIQTSSGQLVPLRSFVTFSSEAQPITLNRYQQFNSATISAVMSNGVTQGQALTFLQETADEILPRGYTYNYAGGSLQFIQEGNTLAIAFLFALIVIFLMLSSKFESFRDPFIILISVPMSICGALIPLYIGSVMNIGSCTLNIYSELGLITLIGLISKHGILIVEFANQLQEQGIKKMDAIIQAASVRLRPILMTTAAMVAGVVPLIYATGAGAVSRQSIGIVIVFGLTIGTMFTIFIVPTMYAFISKDRSKFIENQKRESREIAEIDAEFEKGF